MRTVIECVPNISEGRDPEIVSGIAEAVRAAPGVRLLDVSSDASHNRSVLTFVADSDGLRAGIRALFDAAVSRIDLTLHSGEHPRMGAVDVVPIIPIRGATVEQCVALSREIGAEIAARHRIPVYLYEDSATSEKRRNLAEIRKGEFEGFAAKMQGPDWKPDFGPEAPHPTAGVVAVGARAPLIAYNINLATDRLDVAKKIAAAIRQSSGGFRYVKAAGFMLQDRGIVQVSMNLTNYEKTPIYRVFETVKREAERYGVSILESEIVGLVPAAALNAAAEFYLQIAGFKAEQILENKLRQM